MLPSSRSTRRRDPSRHLPGIEAGVEQRVGIIASGRTDREIMLDRIEPAFRDVSIGAKIPALVEQATAPDHRDRFGVGRVRRWYRLAWRRDGFR